MTSSEQSIFLSVIVPTCDRPELLVRCLACLRPGVQSYPAERYEVLVTDDSTDSHDAAREKFPWVRWVRGPRRGPAANRNNGARHASAEHLVFVDDDCLPDADWLENIAAAFQRGAEVVEGKTICPDGRDSPFEERIENLHGGVLWSCNMAIQRQLFACLGGFDEDFTAPGGEDIEFAWRVRRAGARQVFERGAIVEHPARKIGLMDLIRRLRMIRWVLLYRHKVGEATSLESSDLAALANVAAFYSFGCARLGWRFIRHFQKQHWRTRLFEFVWKACTLPLVLPYLLWWELRFRGQLSRRTRQPGTACCQPG
jgi:GT2 family glycosyltransferase